MNYQQTNEKHRKEVQSLIGQTIGTVYGPSKVVKVEDAPDGLTYVHLLEGVSEPYSVELSEWPSLKA